MIVVADSSPLHYLILIQQADLLRRLYGNVLIPDAVVAELCAAGAPLNVSAWISHHPPWLRIVQVPASEIASISDELDLGERAPLRFRERAAPTFS